MKPQLIVGSTLLLAAVGGSFFGGCKRKAEPGTTQTTSATENAPATTPMLSDEDKAFMTKAAQGGVAEVALGRVATQRSGSPDVRAFGQRMATDHQKAGDELTEMAAKRAVVLPTEVDQDSQKAIAKLLKLN